MSEFSQSYHLKSSDSAAAVQLLEQAGKGGIVFPARSGWVTFVVEDAEFIADEAIVSLNPGLLVYYFYAEDHGWGAQVFNQAELVFDYECEWEEDMIVHKKLYDLKVIQQLAEEQGRDAGELKRILDEENEHEEPFAFEEPPAYLFAETVGLPHYQWLAASYYTPEDPVFEGAVIVKGPEPLDGTEDEQS
ncbi:hypothetical protein [Paenibacillus pinistramenti]|uniref:hypothetical protein n=1 Tax=Paenibacillus pinistramenti TaxID=1768003 RepID=UPI001108F6D0|nr:hypothetical protein [Paenibacillus pinistramenti]